MPMEALLRPLDMNDVEFQRVKAEIRAHFSGRRQITILRAPYLEVEEKVDESSIAGDGRSGSDKGVSD